MKDSAKNALSFFYLLAALNVGVDFRSYQHHLKINNVLLHRFIAKLVLPVYSPERYTLKSSSTAAATGFVPDATSFSTLGKRPFTFE